MDIWILGIIFWVVVSNSFYFQPYLGKIPILTHFFQRGWNHQLVLYVKEWANLICILFLGFSQGESQWKAVGPSCRVMKFGEAKYGPGDLNQERSACFFAIMC